MVVGACTIALTVWPVVLGDRPPAGHLAGMVALLAPALLAVVAVAALATAAVRLAGWRAARARPLRSSR